MKKEFLPICVRRNGKRVNVMFYFKDGKSRYAKTQAEAQEAIDNALELFKPRKEPVHDEVGGFGIEIGTGNEEYDDLEIVDSYIEEREVTEWKRAGSN